MLPPPRRKKAQEIDLGLRRATADHRPLDGMLGADAKALHHAAAHHAPAQRSHHFPEFYARGIDAAASLFVTGEQLLPRAEPANRSVDLAEAPRIDADPS